MTNPTLSAILKRHDAGKCAQDIAEALDVSRSYVYSVLREHRPNRARKAHKKRSDLPRMIAGMHAQGIKPPRIAVVLGVSRQYVHRVLST